MTWAVEGGRVILTLRLAALSQVWRQVFRNYLGSLPLPGMGTKLETSGCRSAKAA